MGKLNRRGENGTQKNRSNIIVLPDRDNYQISAGKIKLNRRGESSPEVSLGVADFPPNDKPLHPVIAETISRDLAIATIFRETRGRGRPSKLTEDLIVNLEVLARIGLAQKAMAEAVAVDEATLIGWMKSNKPFAARINKARNFGKAFLVNSIFGHGVKNWQAHAWLLERMHRGEFAIPNKVEFTGKDSGPVVFKVVYEEVLKKEQDQESTKGNDKEVG